MTMKTLSKGFQTKHPNPSSLKEYMMLTLADLNIMRSFIDIGPYKNIFPSLIQYTNGLKRSLHHYADIKRYTAVNSDQPIIYKEKTQTQSFHKILAKCIEAVKLISALITNSQSCFIRI